MVKGERTGMRISIAESVNMRNYGYGYAPWYKKTGVWITIAVMSAVVLGCLSFALGHWLDVSNIIVRSSIEFMQDTLFPGTWPTPVAWLVLTAALTSVVINFRHKREMPYEVTAMVGVIGLVVAGIGMWDNDKDGARSYERSTVFVVQNIDKTPRSLEPIVSSAQKAETDECKGLKGTHDNYSCIEQGTFPSGWERRSASATGARTVMSRTSGDVPNTYLMADSLTYLYGSTSVGRWTAIRDGKNRQSVFGVVSWDGSNNQPTTCRFEGSNKINYAFEGRWGRNLDDLIAARYRTLLYDSNDIWGYCDEQNSPAIVIATTELESFGNRTTRRPAGVITIKGSASGEPVITRIKDVKAGKFPGPVYPTWLVNQQRDAVQWAAGRGNKNRLKFGYEDTDVQSQAGNTENYLLRSKDDGRTYWVTPMTPRSGESQQLVAFSITPADEVTSGQLNQQRVYVLPDGDSSIVANLDDLLSRVTQEVSRSDPGFFAASGGRIAEFLPVDESTWQVFAERNGRVVYRIDVAADARITPKVYSIEDGSETSGTTQPSGGTEKSPTGQNAPLLCDTSKKSAMTTPQLAKCIKIFADELGNRAAQE